jgi:uncharacterized membrane protein (UPF0127 family)
LPEAYHNIDVVTGQSKLTPAAIVSGQQVRVRNATRQTELAASLYLALGPFSRLRGLLARPPLTAQEALLLRPCRGVHTCLMTYTIDVAFLSAEGRVVGVQPNLRPWHFTRLFDALCALELCAGRLALTGTQAGDRLEFESVE